MDMWLVFFIIIAAVGGVFLLIGATGIIISPNVAFVISAVFLTTVCSIGVYILYLKWKGNKSKDILAESRKDVIANYKKWENRTLKLEVPGKRGYSQKSKIPHVFGEEEFVGHLLYFAADDPNAGHPCVIIQRVKPSPWEIYYENPMPEPSEIDNVFFKYENAQGSKQFNDLLAQAKIKLPSGQTVYVGQPGQTQGFVNKEEKK